MASQEERENFFSLSLLLFRVGNQRLREYFKTQWPIVYQRVRPGTVPPPWQDTPHDATEMKKIQPTKLKFKFKDEETKFNSGNTNDWDFSLLTSVLKYSSLHFVLPSSPESKGIDDLKAIRNKLIGHVTDAAIPNAVFNTAWTDACNALALFKATAADFKSVQDDVKKPLDVLYPMLKQCLKQEKEIQDSVDTIINRVEQLQQTVVKQHTTLQQTVEKQHETQLEAVGRIESKVDQILDQGQQGQKRASANVQEDSKKLKEATKENTEYQTKFISGHDIPSKKTDEIFTNLTVYYVNKKRVRKEQEKDLSGGEQLQGCTERTEGFKVEKFEDIFIDMEGKNPKLLLTGQPGIGKTIFCKKNMRDWSMDRLFQNEGTPDIKFAYMLKFRQLSSLSDKEMNLQELLNCSPFLVKDSFIGDSLFEYLTKNSSKVMIILDGFDEYSQEHREQIASDFEEGYSNNSTTTMPIPALCSKLIKGKLLTNSVVLVSSRPGKEEELGEIKFDRFVEIAGFSPEQVTEFVDNYFCEPEKEQTKNTVREHVEKNENLVSLCHIPLLCFLLCWCLEWRVTQSVITKNLPAKITDLYDEVVKVVVQKLHAKLKYLRMSGNTVKIAGETLDKLANLAASLLKESKFIFDEEDMKKLNLSEDEIKNLKVSGILHCVPGIRNSPFETKTEYSFLHLTLQEYLSASFFVKNKELPEEVSRQTRVFMSGLMSRKKDGELMKRLIQQITPEDDLYDVNRLLMLQCLYEYGEDELTKLTINNLYNVYCDGIGRIRFGGVTEYVDAKYLSYLLDIIHLLKEQHPLQSSSGYALYISGSPLTSFGVGIVCDSLVRNSFITGLTLTACSLDDECVEKMTDSLVNTGITHLYLMGNKITDEGVKSICSVLTQTKITELDLRENNITDEGVKSICGVLTQTNITHLDLRENNITDGGVKSICSVLTQTNITDLYLTGNKITDEGVKSICSVLTQTNMTHLYLDRNEITDEGVKSICSVLTQTNITHLNLAGNKITDEGVKSICSVLTQTKITHLDLMGINITDEGAGSICRVIIQDDCPVTGLYLSYNENITEECKKRVLELVQKHKRGVIFYVT